jgi:hypothetical protein
MKNAAMEASSGDARLYARSIFRMAVYILMKLPLEVNPKSYFSASKTGSTDVADAKGW